MMGTSTALRAVKRAIGTRPTIAEGLAYYIVMPGDEPQLAALTAPTAIVWCLARDNARSCPSCSMT